MDDSTYLKPLACECSNKGATIWWVVGTERRLHDVDGDFHRDSRDEDAPIVCDLCGRTIAA